MRQKERDRLVALKRARKKLITQRQAAGELGVSERQVRRLLYSLKTRQDKAVIQAGRGLPSIAKIDQAVQDKAVKVLSHEIYKGFGPTLAAEYLANKHHIRVGTGNRATVDGQGQTLAGKATTSGEGSPTAILRGRIGAKGHQRARLARPQRADRGPHYSQANLRASPQSNLAGRRKVNPSRLQRADNKRRGAISAPVFSHWTEKASSTFPGIPPHWP